jgi:hypothetical protein
VSSRGLSPATPENSSKEEEEEEESDAPPRGGILPPHRQGPQSRQRSKRPLRVRRHPPLGGQ